jgi:hypothetical protein
MGGHGGMARHYIVKSTSSCWPEACSGELPTPQVDSRIWQSKADSNDPPSGLDTSLSGWLVPPVQASMQALPAPYLP